MKNAVCAGTNGFAQLLYVRIIFYAFSMSIKNKTSHDFPHYVKSHFFIID